MRPTEELILPMLDEQSGYLEMIPGSDFTCVTTGAVTAGYGIKRVMFRNAFPLRRPGA